jgi:Zn-dependent protease
MLIDQQFLLLGVIWYFAFVLSATIHEAAHAWAAKVLGDPTGYLGGQVSLDPTPHMQRAPLGMILVPIISFFLYEGRWMMGWANCPYDPRWAMDHPRRAGWMALAGPISNAILCLLAALMLKLGLTVGYFAPPVDGIDAAHLVTGTAALASEGVAVFSSVMLTLNLVLMVFNLFPMPPLDGSAVLLIFLPEDTARKVQLFLWDPTYQMLGLIGTIYLAPHVIVLVWKPVVLWVLM